MEDFATLAGLVAVATQVTTLVKYLAARQGAKAFQVVLPWITLAVVLFLGAEADAFADVVLPGLDVSLGVVDVATLLLYSVSAGSAAGFAYKVVTAVDGSDSAAEPSLGSGRPSQ